MAEPELLCEGCRWRDRQISGLARKNDELRKVVAWLQKQVSLLIRKPAAKPLSKSDPDMQGTLQLL